MTQDGDEVSALYDKLSVLVANEDHKKALKVTEQILKLSPNDQDAVKCKVAALIQLSLFDDAFKCITSSKQSSELVWEKAYCLYRLSKFNEALSVAQKVPEDDARRWELEAQLHYKLGNSKECITSYDRVFHVNKAPSLDLKANVLAAYVAADLASEVVKLMTSMKITSKQSFEIGFNKACGLVESGQYAAAETELKQAFKLARETLLLEEQTEEVVEEETAPILVQQGFVLARTGQLQEAVAQYEKVMKGGHADEATSALLTVNSIADGMLAHTAAHHKKFFGSSLKKLDALTDKDQVARLLPPLEAALSERQKLAIHLNRGLLAAMAGRLDQAAAIAQHLAAQRPDSAPVALLQASVLAKSGKAQEADAQLAAFSAAHPADADQATLMRAQLALEAGNHQAANDLLASLSATPLGACPALLATRCSLYEQSGNSAGAEAFLQSALAALQRGGGGGGVGALQCLQSLVELKLRLGKAAEAAQAYQQLRGLKADTSATAQVLAKLTRATAAMDPQLAQSYEADLGAGPRCSAEELDALEQSLRSAAPARVSKKRDAEGDAGGEGKTKKRKKKKKPQYPKGFDPANPGPPPDPERWLAKWQRSDYKKKNRRRRGDIKGSQGAGKVDENLDRTKPMEVDPVPKAPEPKAGGKGKGKGKGRR